LRAKLFALAVLSLTFIAMLACSASLFRTLNADRQTSAPIGSSQVIDMANNEFKSALKAVREAEAAGADASRRAILVERLNSVLGMIDEAEHMLVEGKTEEADAMAERAIDTSKRIISEAIQLRDEASLRTFYDKMFTFSMAPVASLLVTVGAHYGWKFWHRHEVDRVMRMEIKKVKEPEEEK